MSRRAGRRAAPGSGSTARNGGSALEVSGGDGLYLVHAAGDVPAQVPAQLDDAAAMLREGPLTAAAGRATVLVGAGFDDTDALCERLAPALEECRDAGTSLLRLVMSGGAADLPGRPSPARRICEEWGLEVVAPGGVVVVVPDGTLFAPMSPDGGGWWHFSPGLLPRRLGTRHPEPSWQGALDRVVFDAAVGCTVEPVPAGLLVQPAGAPREGVDAVRYALAADPAGPVILVGTAGTGPVPAEALADVVAALPAPVRGTVRLVPGDGRDLLATGQEVADLLGIEVQVLNGVPVLLDDGLRLAAPPRVVLADADGTPSWRPYVEVVTCVPAAAPRLTTWRAPVGGLRPDKEPGTMQLDAKWQVAVTRAGLWVGPHGARVPAPIAQRAVEPSVMTVDLGLPGRPLDDTLWAPLDRLFTALEDDVREHTAVQVQGECGPEALHTLRRLTMRHGLALSPRGWTTSRPAGSAVPTTSAARRGTPTAPARPSPATRTGAPAPTPVSRSAPAGTQSSAAPAAGGRGPSVPRTTALTASGAPAPAVPGRTVPAAPASEATAVPAAGRPAAAEEGANSPSGAVPPKPAALPTAAAAVPATAAPDPASPAPDVGESASRPGPAAPGATAPEPRTAVPGMPVPRGSTVGGGPSPASPVGEGAPAAGPAASGAGPATPSRPETMASSGPTVSGPGISQSQSVSSGPARVESGRSELGASAPAAGESGISAGFAAPGIGAAPVRLAGPGSRAGEQEPSVRSGPVGPGAGAAFARLVPALTPPPAPKPPAAGSADPRTGPARPVTPDPSVEEPASNAHVPGSTAPDAGIPHKAAADPAAEHGPSETAGTTTPEQGAVEAPDDPGTTTAESAPGAGEDTTWPPVPVPAAQGKLPGELSSGESSPDGPPEPEPGPGIPEPSAEPAQAGPRVVTWVPVAAGHRSGETERGAVRAYLGARWDHHSGAVSRALTRVPALRASDPPDEVAADLAALHAYLTAAETDRWTHGALRASLEAGRSDLLPLLGCLASGLRRLPSYRGAAVRPASGALGEVGRQLLPGEELGEAVPVSAVALDKGYPSVPADHYLIWSMTGRRASSLLTEAELAPASGGARGEVLFSPGTRLRLLAVAERAGATVMMLRELPESAPQPTAPGRLDDADSAVLARLQALTDQPTAVSSGGSWPERCTGALAVRVAPDSGRT